MCQTTCTHGIHVIIPRQAMVDTSRVAVNLRRYTRKSDEVTVQKETTIARYLAVNQNTA